MLNLMLVVPECELHKQNGLETPWEQGTEVDFHLAFGLCCSFSVKKFQAKWKDTQHI